MLHDVTTLFAYRMLNILRRKGVTKNLPKRLQCQVIFELQLKKRSTKFRCIGTLIHFKSIS